MLLAVSRGRLPGMPALRAPCSAGTCQAGTGPGSVWEHERQSSAVRRSGPGACWNGAAVLHTHLSAHLRGSSAGSCAPHEAGIAAFMEKRANREHMRWVGVGSGFRTRLVFLIRQCWWCLLRKGLWGRGDVLTFCWCCWNARNPPTSQLSAKGEPEHGAWTASQHISAGFPMPS